MSSKALFVGIEARSDKKMETTEFLRGARLAVEEETDTREWYALSFGGTSFAIFDTFPGNAGRLKHLFGQVGRELLAKTFTILSGLPDIEAADIIASKNPSAEDRPQHALFVPLTAESGQEEFVATFLRNAKPLIDEEEGTSAWYALRMGLSSFAIFDVFPDEAARNAHLTGKVAEALMARASGMFAYPPAIRKGEILASDIKV